jgi:hypothetical protein
VTIEYPSEIEANKRRSQGLSPHMTFKPSEGKGQDNLSRILTEMKAFAYIVRTMSAKAFVSEDDRYLMYDQRMIIPRSFKEAVALHLILQYSSEMINVLCMCVIS